MQIKTIDNPDLIGQCHEAFLELRPHLKDKAAFIEQVQAQQKEGYQLAAIFADEEAAACMGWRIMTFLAWGKILYIDDLITKEKFRGKGYGSALLKYAVSLAREQGCNQIHLDTGYGRHAAHRVYLQHGFEFHCHHLALKI